MVECLECNASIAVPDDVAVGDTIACKTCGELFVVVEIDPIEIDYPDDEGEGSWDDDWDEDWEEDEEEEEEGEEGAAGAPGAPGSWS